MNLFFFSFCRFSALSGFVLFSILPLSVKSQGSCGTDGSIKSGSSITLDPNSDGYFSIYNSSGFTLSNNEYGEFEVLTGSGGANRSWTRLPGSDPASDLLSGGGCGNTDIVTDGDGGSDYAYYSIVDPDGTADNGDEFIAFALRISDKTNGAFGFSFLVDSDNNCSSTDPNSVCGNPCFEYEIQLSTGNTGGDVKVYDVDGCYGSSDCNTAHGAGVDICSGDCNSEGIQVCASGTSCPTGDPVFWVFYVEFSNLPGLNSSDNFSITPGSNTSGNAIVYKSANVSDYGGVDDINDLNGLCDCSTECTGNPCSKCEQDCLLSCAAEQNGLNVPFPVTWLGFSGQNTNTGIELYWEAEEVGAVMGYHIQRLEAGRFLTIDWQKASETNGTFNYRFLDLPQHSGMISYRLVSEDVDGTLSYSTVVEIDWKRGPLFFIDAVERKIIYTGSGIEEYKLSIIALTGQEIQTRTVLTNQPIISLNDLRLAKGIYFVKIFSSNEVVLTTKIVIQHDI